MAMQVESFIVGVDVAKAELVISEQGQSRLITLANERRAIRRYLKALAGPAWVAVEATNTYHLALVEEAYRLGHRVYVIDGYRLSRYREGVGGRAKTDTSDARLLARYLQREHDQLRPWSPPGKGYTRLRQLLRRRARLVQVKTTLSQSLKELPELKSSAQAVLRQLNRLDALIQKRLRQALTEHGWLADARRCQAVEGIGEITAAALTMSYNRGAFVSADAFIAFIGMDVRVRDSGRSKGKRKLTKQGDPELRRLLYLAAMTASRSATWQPVYQRYLARGMSPIQAFVALGRKLARIAFSLMKYQTNYAPKLAHNACAET
ncbi:transposase [Ectothiorhodospiraceae bacterium WFHF3C12]|nr:transposase [Ectothiorhodospiraceae bacterium WFHF3C12]MBA1147642.1 transposase [Ectothiorhodospiraceae bacterium WFHF3C12]MBA1148025.1 transposase [Ectothiorhodospiraceae bacterium WFHF3C12]MBA1148649.1 transposase [Ectothiorhodospiraceae bacterium WFHF3C12]MBA1148958.1 transposase [Ectothiorhodospiraceae bacterium WFHF3C12]